MSKEQDDAAKTGDGAATDSDGTGGNRSGVVIGILVCVLCALIALLAVRVLR